MRRLQTHRYELGPILFECDKAIEQSEQHVASATRIRALRAEKHRRAANIAKSSVERERIKADNNECMIYGVHFFYPKYLLLLTIPR